MRCGTARELVAIGGCLLSLYLLFLPAEPLSSPDEEILLRTAVSLIHGNRGAIPPLPMGFATQTGKDGREYAQYGLGLPLAVSPFLAASLAAQGRLGGGFQVVAYRPLRLCACTFNLFVTFFTVLIVRVLLLQLGLSRRESLFAALLFGIATIAWPHGRTFFTEPLAGLCVLGSIALLLQNDLLQNGLQRTDLQRTDLLWTDSTPSSTSDVPPPFTGEAGRGSPRPAILLCAGFLYGWAILTRLDSLVAAPAVAWAAAQKVTDIPGLLRRWVLVGLPVLGILLCIAGYNTYRFGAVFSTGYEDQTEGVRFLTPILVGLHGNLLTPGRSVFVYSPVLLLALPGALALWRRDRPFAVAAGLVVGGYLGAMSKWQNWAGGSDWGPRHIFQITPWLAIAASVWFFSHSRRPRWMWGLLVLSLAMQLLGLFTDPVQVIRDANLDYNLIGKQMSVYHPARCTPVLHAQWLADHPPNLLFWDLLRQQSLLILLFVIPLCSLGISARFLFLYLDGTAKGRRRGTREGFNPL